MRFQLIFGFAFAAFLARFELFELIQFRFLSVHPTASAKCRRSGRLVRRLSKVLAEFADGEGGVAALRRRIRF